MRLQWIVGLGLIAVSIGCGDALDGRGRPGGGPGIADDDDDDDDAPAVEPRGLDDVFEAKASDYDVPVALLKAIGHVETRWSMVEGEEEFEGRPAAIGLMGLRGERVAEAAALAGLEVEDVARDPAANIEAAAAWLSDRADAWGIEDRTDIGAWADVVAEWSDLPQDWARAAFVYVEVYPRMREGAIEYDEDGEIRAELEPVDAWPNFTVPPPEPALAAGPDYDLSVWRPSPNTSSRPAGTAGARAMIIVHTCEGAYVGCYSWLTNSASGVSAHYVVNSNGTEISQLVPESKKGWHISATYACSKNKNHECFRNGASSNNFTVGIEHAGFANQASWDPGLIDASARLVCDIAKDNGFAIDDVHVVAHGRLQPNNRIDPGPNWPWEEYLALAKQYCDEGAPEPEPEPEDPEDPVPPPAGEIIIDTNNANNDGNVAMFAASSNWTATSATPGFHGSGYLYASMVEQADSATFWFHVAEAGERTIDAWWTAGTNRTTAAPFVAVNAAGTTIGTVWADQSKNGGQWREIGKFSFTAGWNRVHLSRWGTGTKVVIADAIRVR
jgi:N-acetyl-anhydromuramyl-L-alanine amidase AmpD